MASAAQSIDELTSHEGDGSSTPGSSTMGSSTNEPLSVEFIPESYEDEDQLEKLRLSPSLCHVVLKWCVLILLFWFMLGVLVLNKLSVIGIGTALFRSRANHTEPTPEQNAKTSSLFLMLITILAFPYALTMVRSMWNVGFGISQPWPSAKAFLCGLLSSLGESIGISLFAIAVLSTEPSHLNVWIMDGVFLIPIIYQFLITSCRRQSLNRRDTILLSIALVAEVLGIGLTCAFELTTFGLTKHAMEVWPILVSVLLLSAAWSPWLLETQLLPRHSDLIKLIKRKPILERCDRGIHPETPRQEALMQSCTVNREMNQSLNSLTGEDVAWLVKSYPQLSARWTNSVIQSGAKLVFTIGFSLMIGHYFGIAEITILYSGLSQYSYMYTNTEYSMFMCAIFCSFLALFIGWLACTARLQLPCFALPLALASPVSLVLIIINNFNCWAPTWMKSTCESIELWHLKIIIPVAALLFLAEILSIVFFICRTQTIVMQLEPHLFWQPVYNSLFLEQWLLLNRKTVKTVEHLDTHARNTQRSRVFICTPMFRESETEMTQLLRSLQSVNAAKQQSGRHFQAHIFFDNGVCDTKPTKFPLMLMHCIQNVLGINLRKTKKIKTPYGMKFQWKMRAINDDSEGMTLTVHLKDNKKVKNKKRWSQVMYMSFILDYIIKDMNVNDGNDYILTTDADVKFRPESVEALLDLLARDQHVAAVCARTHPLGSGLVYWFQMFDFAIGHWLQKTSNHILGSVLCCPGCFSLFRASALRDVLPTYATTVDKASEFLTKDMGEDRWLCTLLVQRGWHLEYCAASSNSTYCPEEFDEFFKQRRRWIASTLANQVLLLQQWSATRHLQSVSFLFMVYQAVLFLSTLVAPSVCIFVITGGLYYATNYLVSQWLSLPFLVGTLLFFTWTCMRYSQDTQLFVAKCLTAISVVVMALVTVGTIVQIAVDSKTDDDPDFTLALNTSYNASNPLSSGLFEELKAFNFELPMSVSAIYLSALVSMFFITALLHPSEAYCLFHGIWYLFCLPSACLVLLIYSLCNLNDRSWGTREDKTEKKVADGWIKDIKKLLKDIATFCSCCKNGCNKQLPLEETEELLNLVVEDHEQEEKSKEESEKQEKKKRESYRERQLSVNSESDIKFMHIDPMDSPVDVTEWLAPVLRPKYAQMFKDNGYDDTSFVSKMTAKDLENIGIESFPIRQKIAKEIKELPEFEMQTMVPDDIGEWLGTMGLTEYERNFRHSSITNPDDLETLKDMSRDDIKTHLKVTKPGHLQRLQAGIQALRYPTKRELKIRAARETIESLIIEDLAKENPDENAFWEKLRQSCLLPSIQAFANDTDLKDDLKHLRNYTLIVFFMVNTVWIILVTALSVHSDLYVLKTNVLGLAFLVLFGFVLVIQFLTMILHRLNTLLHVLARTPLSTRAAIKTSWAFRDPGEGSPNIQYSDYGDTARLLA